MKNNNRLKILAVALSMSGIIVALGFGCGVGFQSGGGSSIDASSIDNGGAVLGGGDDDGTVIVAGRATVGVPAYTQGYASLLSSLQVVAPSNTTVAEFVRQKESFSENGRATSVNASMLFATTVLSAQVCLDRVTFEQNNANIASRLFFNNLNLNAGPVNNLSDENLGDSINRLARGLWKRNESAAERALLIAAIRESLALDAANTQTQSREAALYLCTVMASSTAGVQF